MLNEGRKIVIWVPFFWWRCLHLSTPSGAGLRCHFGTWGLRTESLLCCLFIFFSVYPVLTQEIELCCSFLALTLTWQLNLVSSVPERDFHFLPRFPNKSLGCDLGGDLTLDGEDQTGEDTVSWALRKSFQGVSNVFWNFFFNLLGIKKERKKGKQGRSRFCWQGCHVVDSAFQW